MDKVLNGLKTVWSKTNRFHRVLFIFLLVELQPFSGPKYGFYCNDPALSYPFAGDTISWKWLMSVCGLTPLVVMLIVERQYHKEDKGKPNNRALKWYKEYLFGYIVNLSIVQILKYIVGSPRPHFFDTCVPQEAATCTESEFISSYTCTKTKHWMWQSDKSFPSGHTSLAIHTGFFVVYYLHRRMSAANPVTRYAQALSAACAVWCAVSRMTDHRHHWWDVLAGLAIGVAVLLYTIHHLCENFECAKRDPETSASNGKSESPIIEGTSAKTAQIKNGASPIENK